MLEFAYATGMRVTEIISLDIDDINFTEGYVNCRKANKQRIIPLGKMSLKALKEYTDNAREILLKEMEDKSIIKISDENISITYKAPTERETFRTEKFKKDLPDLYDTYVEFTPVKSSLLIKIK